MRRIYLIILGLSFASYIKCQTVSDSTILKKQYDFDNYSISIEKFTISKKDLIFTKGTAKFKTIIKKALKEDLNFAGHCIFLFWGCGTCCQQSAIIDTKTKKVVPGPNSVTGFICFPNSRLLIANPKDSEIGDFVLKKMEIYIWENDTLKLIKTQDW